MADIIQFMDAESLTQTAGALTQAVSGMSAAEASAAMGATATTGAKIINFTSKTAAGANNIINFPNAATAAEAAEAYVTAGGTVSEVGAATSAAGAAETVGNFTVTEGGAAGAIGIGGVLSMPLPTAAAAIAPLAGVALGVGLYKLNPEFWTKISKALLPFCYDDTELLPVTVDSSGQVYFPQGAVNAIKNLFSEIPESTTVSDNINIRDSIALNYSSDNYPITIPYTYGTSFYYADNYNVKLSASTKSNTYKVIIRFNNIQYAILAFSTDPFQWTDGNNINTLRTTKNGTHYYASDYGKRSNNILTKPVDLLFDVPLTWTYDNYWDIYSDIVELVLGGTKTESGGEEGVSKWQGQQVPDGTTGINVLTGFDENGNPIYTPYYPVQIPIGDPGVSANPEEQPNPVAPSTNPAIEPWISPNPWSVPNTYPAELPVTDPTPAPLPNPIPDSPTDAVPNPDINPSQDPVDKPNDGKNPDPPQPPTDKGTGEDPIIPVVPPIVSGGAKGLLTVYNPTLSQLNQFGQWLWATPLSQDIGTEFLKMFADPMDAVIGLHEIYATPTNSGESTIKAGYFDSNVPSAVVGNRYIKINCGSIVVEEYYHNYLDYSPYTKCFIYLPFIGIVPVSANDIIGNAVNIKYHVDLYNGSCIAVVTVAKQNYSSTVYQFNGNCAVDLPITSAYNSVVRNAMLGMVSGAIAGGAAFGAVRGAAHSEISVQHSGSFGASYGAMGAKIPYIIVKRPVQKIVYNYSESYGYPAHKMVYVGNCSGYLRAREVRVLSTTATNIEKEMIVNALKTGVYVK